MRGIVRWFVALALLAAACGDGGGKAYRLAPSPTPMATPLAVAAGALDPGFGAGGIVQTSFDWITTGIEDLALLADGRIVVGGTVSVDRVDSFGFARYRPDGTLDHMFGMAGIAFDTTTPISERVDVHLQRIATATDGSIIAIGCTAPSQPCDWLIARYSRDGVLDPSFGNRGVVLFSREYAWPRDVAVGDDGSVVAAGTIGSDGPGNDYLLVRLTAAGTLDPSFGSGGIAQIDVGEDEGEALLLQPDGKIVLGGCTGEAFTLLRLLPDGSRDATFGSNGVSLTHHPELRGTVRALVPGPNGGVVAAGTVDGYAAGAIARFTVDGALDPSFGVGGAATLHSLARSIRVSSVAVDPHGGVVATGQLVVDYVNVFGVLRVDANGAVDSTFGDGGVATTAIGFLSQARAIGVMSDGGILAAGISVDRDTFFTLARFGGGTR